MLRKLSRWRGRVEAGSGGAAGEAEHEIEGGRVDSAEAVKRGRDLKDIKDGREREEGGSLRPKIHDATAVVLDRSLEG